MWSLKNKTKQNHTQATTLAGLQDSISQTMGRPSREAQGREEACFAFSRLSVQIPVIEVKQQAEAGKGLDRFFSNLMINNHHEPIYLYLH